MTRWLALLAAAALLGSACGKYGPPVRSAHRPPAPVAPAAPISSAPAPDAPDALETPDEEQEKSP
jgi:hypothetical protein